MRRRSMMNLVSLCSAWKGVTNVVFETLKFDPKRQLQPRVTGAYSNRRSTPAGCWRRAHDDGDGYLRAAARVNCDDGAKQNSTTMHTRRASRQHHFGDVVRTSKMHRRRACRASSNRSQPTRARGHTRRTCKCSYSTLTRSTDATTLW